MIEKYLLEYILKFTVFSELRRCKNISFPPHFGIDSRDENSEIAVRVLGRAFITRKVS